MLQSKRGSAPSTCILLHTVAFIQYYNTAYYWHYCSLRRRGTPHHMQTTAFYSSYYCILMHTAAPKGKWIWLDIPAFYKKSCVRVSHNICYAGSHDLEIWFLCYLLGQNVFHTSTAPNILLGVWKLTYFYGKRGSPSHPYCKTCCCKSKVIW